MAGRPRVRQLCGVVPPGSQSRLQARRVGMGLWGNQCCREGLWGAGAQPAPPTPVV